MQPLVGSAHLLFHSRSLRSAEMGGVISIVLSLGSFLPHAPLRVHPHRRRAAGPGRLYPRLGCISHRFVASSTASTHAVSGLSFTSHVPVNNTVSRTICAVTAVN